MTETPPEPPDIVIGPEGPVHEDEPLTEPDGAPDDPSPQWA